MRPICTLFVAGVLAAGLAAAAQQATPAPASQNAPVVREIGTPPYHRTLPKGGLEALPPTLNPSQFRDPRVQASYAMAAKIRGVLYKQPCYCGCDKEAIQHKSLLSCFNDDHASICQTCMMEGVFAYQETQKGKTPGQIRAEIKRGQWKSVNLNDLLLSGLHY
ncbi:MAG: CYCXC family (seleno)protein [Terriglobales bacterium]